MRKLNVAITKPARAGLTYLIISVTEKLILLLMTPVYTRILSKEEFGTYSLYVAYMGLFTIFGTLELSGGAVYMGINDERCAKATPKTAMNLILICSAALLCIYLAFGGAINRLFGLTAPLAACLILRAAANGIINTRLSLARSGYGIGTYAAISLAIAVISPILSVILIKLFDTGAYGRIAGDVITGTMAAIIIFILTMAKAGKPIDGYTAKRLFSYAAPLVPHHLAVSLIAASGKITIGRALGAGALGGYSLAFSLGFIPAMLAQGVLGVELPWLYRREGEVERVRRVGDMIYRIICNGALIFTCFIPEVLRIMAPPEYGGAIAVIYLTAFTVPLSYLQSKLSSILSGRGMRGSVTVISVLSALACLALDLITVGRYGIIAAAAVRCAAIALSVVLLLIRLYAIGDRVVPLRGVLFNTGYLIVGTALIYLCRASLLARILLFFVLILVLLPKIDIKMIVEERKEKRAAQ